MMLSPEQIEAGFWAHDPSQNFPPPSITYPEDYDGAARLNLVCTQLDIPSSKQRKLVKLWSQVLPRLSDVRFLWLSSRVNQPIFEAACSMAGLEGLYIEWSGIKDLSPLLNLVDLKYLSIGSSAQVQSIDCLRHMHGLVVLEIENLKKISNLEPLAGLTQLEGLAVEGSTWTTQIVDSLRPLVKLRNLKYLFLSNLRTKDNSLEPLTKLDSLIHLRTAFWWSEEEFIRLREALPRLKYGSLFNQELITLFAHKKGSQ